MIRSTCPYCGTGCGLILTPTADGVDVRGDPDHPANFGRLCSKGSALGETVGLRGRLLQPQIHGQRAEWDTLYMDQPHSLSFLLRQISRS